MKIRAIALLTLSVSLTTFSPTRSAENDECHMISPSGEKIDLSQLCQTPSTEDPNINQQNNNNNTNQRVVYGEQEVSAPIKQTPKLNSQAGKRNRQQEIERKRIMQEYSQYQQYIKYYRENSGNF